MPVRLFISNLLKLHQTLQRLLLLLGMQSFDIFAKHTVRVYYKKYQEDKYFLIYLNIQTWGKQPVQIFSFQAG